MRISCIRPLEMLMVPSYRGKEELRLCTRELSENQPEEEGFCMMCPAFFRITESCRDGCLMY